MLDNGYKMVTWLQVGIWLTIFYAIRMLKIPLTTNYVPSLTKRIVNPMPWDILGDHATESPTMRAAVISSHGLVISPLICWLIYIHSTTAVMNGALFFE